MSKALPIPVASAVIQRGAMTNRVQVAGGRIRARAASRAPDGVPHPRKAKRRWTDAPAVVVGVSMTEAELGTLDRAAESARVSRSEFVREAVRAFAQRQVKP